MLTRWNAFWPWEQNGGLGQLRQELNRLAQWDGSLSDASIPPINVWSGKDEMLVEAEIPGIDPKELDISVMGDTLTIRGVRKVPEIKEGDVIHRQERTYGEFVRTVELPSPADPDRTDATYEHGVLTVKIKKAEAAKTKQIAVKSA